VGGVTFAPAIHSAVVFSGLSPVVAVLLAALTSGRMPGRSKIWGTAFVVVGLVLFASNAIVSTATVPGSWRGDALFALAAVVFALFGMLLGRWKIGPLEYLTPVCVLSMLSLPVWALGGLPRLSSVGVGAIALQAAYQGALVSIASMILFAKAISFVGPVRSALFVPLAPLATAVFAALVLGEFPMPLEAAGMCLVIVGIAVGVGGGAIPFRRSRVELDDGLLK